MILRYVLNQKPLPLLLTLITEKGRYKFNYMKVINMYRGESMRRDGIRFFGSCSGLIFSTLVLTFYFLSTFWLDQTYAEKEHLSFMMLLYIIKLFEDQVTCLIFCNSVILWKKKISVSGTSLKSQGVPHKPTGNWDQNNARALLCLGHWICLFAAFLQ